MRYAVIAVLLVVLAVIDKPESTLFWDALFDAGHAPLFAAIVLLLRGALVGQRPEESPGRTSLRAFGLAVLLGIASEAVQVTLPDRDPSWADLARNAAGAGAALLFLHTWWSWRADNPLARRKGAWAAAAGGLLVVLTLVELSDTLVALYRRSRAMPTIAAFDGSRWEQRVLRVTPNRLTPAGAVDEADAPPGLARLDLQPATYSGLSIDEPFPDWRGYQALTFTVVAGAGTTLPLTVRIHDARHDKRYRDRFNATLRIAPGSQTIRIPLDEVRTAPDGREMDMGRIRGVMLFAHRLQQPARLYLGPMRLERAGGD